MIEDAILDKMTLTPAERQVVLEQIESIKVSLDDMQAAVESWNKKALMHHYDIATDYVAYLTGMLTASIKRAMRCEADE